VNHCNPDSAAAKSVCEIHCYDKISYTLHVVLKAQLNFVHPIAYYRWANSICGQRLIY